MRPISHIRPLRPIRPILLLIICLASLATLHAETNGRKILDNAVSRIKKMGELKADFTATTFTGTTEQGSTSGTMLLKGRKFKLTTPEMTTWYGGEKQWCYVPETEEVNLSIPTQKEMQAVNPYSFMSLYKKGYNISVRESSLRGQLVYEVHLIAKNVNYGAQEIYVDISCKDYALMCIRVRQDKDWHRISIHSCTGEQHFQESDFTFPKELYPDAELIDLR